MKILSQSSVKAKQVPVLSFAARGTLLHDSPAFDIWCLKYLESRSVRVSEEDLRENLLRIMEDLNQRAEEGESDSFGVEEILSHLLSFYFGTDQRDSELRRALDMHHQSVKVVLPKFVMDVCEELKKRGYRLCLLSNETPAVIEVLRAFQLLDLFELVLLSGDVGFSKPDPRFFRSLLEELEIDSSQVIHIGDRYATDVLGAQRAGLESILYDPRSQERSVLSRAQAGADKVVQLEDLRKMKFYRDARILSQFEDLLEFFQ